MSKVTWADSPICVHSTKSLVLSNQVPRLGLHRLLGPPGERDKDSQPPRSPNTMDEGARPIIATTVHNYSCIQSSQYPEGGTVTVLVLQVRTPRHGEVRPPAPVTRQWGQVSSRQDWHSQKLPLPWFTFRGPPHLTTPPRPGLGHFQHFSSGPQASSVDGY